MKNSWAGILTLLLGIVLIAALIGCQPSAPSPTPSPTSKPTPGSSPTPTPTASTPAPTAKPTSTPSATTPGSTKPINLIFSTYLAQTHHLSKNVTQRWADEVEKRSGGRIKVNIYWGGSLHSSGDAIKAIKAGITDVTNGGGAIFPGEYQMAEFDMLPVPFRDEYVATRVVEELYPKYVNPEFVATGVMHLYPQTIPNSHLISTKPIKTVADLKGVKVRAGAGVTVDAFKLLEAVPVTLPASEIYTSLQRKLVDATHYSFASAATAKLYEVSKYVIVMGPGFINGNNDITMNPQTWKSLPADLKKVVWEVSREAGMWAADSFYALDVEALDKILPQNGMEIIRWSDEEVKKLMEKTAPIIDTYIKDAEQMGYKNAREYWNELQRLSQKYDKMTPDEIKKLPPVPMEVIYSPWM